VGIGCRSNSPLCGKKSLVLTLFLVQSLVTSVLDRRTDKIRRARAVRKEGDDDEMEDLLNLNVRSPKWLAQASSPSGNRDIAAY
jgi:hypothetical protein